MTNLVHRRPRLGGLLNFSERAASSSGRPRNGTLRAREGLWGAAIREMLQLDFTRS